MLNDFAAASGLRMEELLRMITHAVASEIRSHGTLTLPLQFRHPLPRSGNIVPVAFR